MATEVAEERETLRHLMRTDPDPRVRHRAHALLLMGRRPDGGGGGAAVWNRGASGARLARALSRGGTGGLVDRSRRGRPPKLGEQRPAFLQQALEQGPQAYGLPVTVWSVRDLQALRAARARDCGECLHTASDAAGAGLSLPSSAARSASPSGRRSGRGRQARARLAPKKSLPASGRSAALGPHLVYVDECEIHTHPHLARSGGARGSR